MCCQAAQLAYIIDEWLKEVAEEAYREKALKEVAVAIVKDKGKAIKATKKKAQASEKAQILVEKRLIEMDVKLGGMKLKLAETESLNLARADEIADLKATFEACEKKWYNEGFVDAKNSVVPIVYQAPRHGFGEGWMAVLQTMGEPEDSPLKNPEQIPFPTPPSPIQTQFGARDEKDTPSMRELVRKIDTHVELVDLKVTSNLNAVLHGAQPTKDVQAQLFSAAQPIEEAPAQPAEDTALSQSTDPAAQIWRRCLPYCTPFLFFVIYFSFIWFCLWSPGCGDKTLVKFQFAFY